MLINTVWIFFFPSLKNQSQEYQVRFGLFGWLFFSSASALKIVLIADGLIERTLNPLKTAQSGGFLQLYEDFFFFLNFKQMEGILGLFDNFVFCIRPYEIIRKSPFLVEPNS